MYDAPLYQALKDLIEKDALRFHMPGHKGIFMPDEAMEKAAAFDYTEIRETGNLYTGDGPIAEAEARAASYFGARDCHFLTGGATMGIKAALSACAGAGARVLSDRNCHKSVIEAAILLGLTIDMITPDVDAEFGITTDFDRAICELSHYFTHIAPETKVMIVTSPTYYGVRLDIRRIAQICKACGVLLIVDEAHGAHFRALGCENAIEMGANIAIVSAHKTLPVFGQGAYLLSDKTVSMREIRRACSLFGTSSPSYLIMASLDLARAYLEKEGEKAYRAAAAFTNDLRERLARNTRFRCAADGTEYRVDPCRLTVNTRKLGISAHEIACILENEHGIYCEMATGHNLVFIVTGADDQKRITAIYDALFCIDKAAGQRTVQAEGFFKLPSAKYVFGIMPPRCAYFSKKERLPLSLSEGRILAEMLDIYPPGVCIAVPGESLSKVLIDYLVRSGYNMDTMIDVVSGADTMDRGGGFSHENDSRHYQSR